VAQSPFGNDAELGLFYTTIKWLTLANVTQIAIQEQSAGNFLAGSRLILMKPA
jgi:hypothetical protein